MKMNDQRLGFFVILIFAVLASAFFNIKVSAVEIQDEDQFNVDFDTRLRFYLDSKTRRFLERMSLKEEALTHIIRNISDEMQQRGNRELSQQEIGFEQIYGRADQILNEYNQEINNLKSIIKDLDKLELIVQRKDDLKLLQEVEGAKEQLMKALESPNLGDGLLTNEEKAQRIHEYSKEIKNLLKIYDEISIFEQRATHMGDAEAVKYLRQQKERIVRIFEDSRVASGSTEGVVNDYIHEAASMVDILKKLDRFKWQADLDSTLVSDVDSARGMVMKNIDNRLFNLFGYTTSGKTNGPTLSDYFYSWKTKKVSEYQVRFTHYRILRSNLIWTATAAQRNRMLEAELSDALISYADNRFQLAEMLFTQILNAYQEYYPNLDGVIFYRSESNYANNYYDAARAGYLEIIENYPDSKFSGQSHLRMLAIAYTYHQYDDFFKYYEPLHQFSALDREDINKAHYLAALTLINQRRLESSREILERIDDKSDYYLVAQYLRGL
ncbi:MAG: hypothetical protein SCK70_12630, partial [bacterium]|nr:hypothetical protein [bacterium]